MSVTEQILVIILAAFLAIFLLASILALIKINQILKNIRSITAKAEHLADQAEHVGEFFQKSAGPVAAAKIIANIIGSIKEHKGHKEKSNEKN